MIDSEKINPSDIKNYNEILFSLGDYVHLLEYKNITKEVTGGVVLEHFKNARDRERSRLIETLSRLKTPNKQQIMEGKEQVYQAGLRRCIVFLAQLTQDGVRLYKYEDNINNLIGYAIFHGKNPKYWLPT